MKKGVERKASRLVIQEPRREELAVNTTVTVPDGKTLVLGGQTYFPDDTPNDAKGDRQTVLFLVRAAPMGPETLPKGNLPANATITLQTKFLTIPSDTSRQLRNTFMPPGQPPLLDDTRADAMVKAVQSSAMGAVITSPRLTVVSGSSATSDTLKPTPYVGAFAVIKNSAGMLAYTPEIETLQDGCSVKLQATVVPERNAAAVCVDIALTNLDALETFAFQEKPLKVTLQQPNRRVMSASVQACIPDKNWLVIGPFCTEGRVESEVRPSLISRLVGGKPRRVVNSCSSDLYILIRPEAQAPTTE